MEIEYQNMKIKICERTLKLRLDIRNFLEERFII